MARGPVREPIALGEAVSALARRLPNPRNLHAGAPQRSRALRTFYSAASTLPAPRRSTRLAQYGGPRGRPLRHVGRLADAPQVLPLRGSRSASATLVGSVTSASSFILPHRSALRAVMNG